MSLAGDPAPFFDGGRQLVLRLAGLLAVVAVGVLLATGYLVLPWVVAGPSMQPTLKPGDRVLVDLWTYRHRAPRPGEIALFVGPAPSRGPLVKRIAPAPPFPTDRPNTRIWDLTAVSSEPGIWVLGDHPAESDDSRRFGAVPRERFVGRVVLRYWPPSRAGGVR